MARVEVPSRSPSRYDTFPAEVYRGTIAKTLNGEPGAVRRRASFL